MVFKVLRSLTPLVVDIVEVLRDGKVTGAERDKLILDFTMTIGEILSDLEPDRK